MIRIGILAGVSTDVQAGDDRASIPDQIKTCRNVIKQLGAVEVGLFVMDGYSRTGYDSLADAMNDIPPLKEAITAAEQNKLDVLMLDNFDRLGDLGQLVYTRFKRHKKQLYSARQSGRLQDPDTYNPTLDESGVIDMHINSIIQSYRISKLQRGLELGVQKRVEDGRYSHRYPFGYKLQDGKLVRSEPGASLLITLKDEFFKGASLQDLARLANESGIPSPFGGRWGSGTLSRTLHNPFYAGKVFNKRYKNHGWKISPAGNRIYKQTVDPDAQLYDGIHAPLWTWAEYLRIERELEARFRLMPRKFTHVFSGLLICPICKRRSQVRATIYRCPVQHEGQVWMYKQEAAEKIGKAFAEALKHFTPDEPAAATPDPTHSIQALERQIAKVQQGYENDLYSATEAKQKVDALRGQIRRIEAAQMNESEQRATRERIASRITDMLDVLDEYPVIFADESIGEENNRLLRDLVSGIIVKDNSEFTFLWL